jgi:NAD(P)H dehydrogenase (quinone)
MILVTGAGGKTGRTLVKRLSKVEPVCALLHREEQIPVLKALGADKIILGDMRDKSSVRSAMQGARSVYHICPNMSPDEVVIGILVIGEAQKAGIERFVYHSVIHPQTEKMKHHWQKLRVEELILESEMPFTILQPASYMQNLLAGWKSIRDDGLLRVPYSVEAKFSFIDLEDLAEAARIVLTEPGHLYATYELAGTTPLSHIEIATIFERVIDQVIRVEREETRDWRLRVKSLNRYAIDNLIGMFEYYDRWGLAGNPNVLRWLLGREPASLEEFITRTVKEPNAVH